MHRFIVDGLKSGGIRSLRNEEDNGTFGDFVPQKLGIASSIAWDEHSLGEVSWSPL